MSQVNTSPNTAVGSLQKEIRLALREPDPVLANLKITRCHYLLAQALQRTLGEGAGANFHSWAVWGSRKAGVTIRQEDLDQAKRDGSVVGGVVGALVGLGCGWLATRLGTGVATRRGAARGRVRLGRGAAYYSAQPEALGRPDFGG